MTAKIFYTLEFPIDEDTTNIIGMFNNPQDAFKALGRGNGANNLILIRHIVDSTGEIIVRDVYDAVLACWRNLETYTENYD